jgi:hypothetical protein
MIKIFTGNKNPLEHDILETIKLIQALYGFQIQLKNEYIPYVRGINGPIGLN